MRDNLSMKTFVIDLLKNNIPSFYYYHNYEHTLYVVEKAIEIGNEENCTQEEIELICAASLWHDTGFIKTYDNHEEESCVLARRYLPEFGYATADIDKICGMIMATKIPQLPKNKLEEIVVDADLEYLATTDAVSKADHLFKEWRHMEPSLTREEWNKRQISFLQAHHYFTSFCKENKEPIKSVYMDKLYNIVS